MTLALVLAGGAARGAYEVGVVKYLLEDLSEELGRPVPLDILSGTSAGAINACMLAAHADRPRDRAALLAHYWTTLRVEEFVRPNKVELLGMVTGLFGRERRPPKPGEVRRGGLVDPAGVEKVVRDAIPFDRIADNLREGHLRSLTVSTTHVASGKTVIFVQTASGEIPVWARDPTMLVRGGTITADHALASAAVPLIFPAVRIRGDFYCDGGLRQNVPLSPARRLGATRLIVVNPRHIDESGPAEGSGEPGTSEEEVAYPGPLFLFGKALNALLLDRIDNDIERLRSITSILEAGTRRFGPTFVDQVNEELGRPPSAGLRPLHVVHVRASADIGKMAEAYVRSPRFASRAPGWLGSFLRRIGEGAGEADLLSYLLFDGEFAAELVALGYEDTRARREELLAFFAEEETTR